MYFYPKVGRITLSSLAFACVVNTEDCEVLLLPLASDLYGGRGPWLGLADPGGVQGQNITEQKILSNV